jgi:predicted DCC family thiol-disulfide oxidoreductase YuxK
MRSASLSMFSLATLPLITSSAAFAPVAGYVSKNTGGVTQQHSLQSSSSLASASTSDVLSSELEFDWETVAKQVFDGDERPVILFDGVCLLCNGGVNFALDHDSVGKFRYASLQSKAGQSLLIRAGKKPTDTSSIVLITPTEAYFKSDAVLRIAAKLDGNPLLPLAGSLGPLLVPRFLRNVVYDFVASNRYRFGEAEQCRLDFDNDFGSRFVPDEL